MSIVQKEKNVLMADNDQNLQQLDRGIHSTVRERHRRE